MSQNVSKEIEDEANSYFQRIYNHPPHPTLSIDEVLEMLKKFQHSPNKRERVRNTFICNHLDFLQRNAFESCMNSFYFELNLFAGIYTVQKWSFLYFFGFGETFAVTANLMFSQWCCRSCISPGM